MSTLSFLVIAALLIAVLLTLIDSGKKVDKKITAEDEHNHVSQKSSWEITNDFFLLKLNEYLKNHYPHLLSWEYVSTNPFALHYMEQGFEVRLFFKNGLSCKEHIETKKVWGNVSAETVSKPSAQTTATNTDISQSKPVSEVKEPNSVEMFLIKHSSDINDTINNVKKEGAGLFAYYEVDKNIATESFMEELRKTLEENTGYEVSFEGNVLEIGFQNDL